VGHSTLLAICILMILVVYNENVFKARPGLLGICSFVIAITMEVYKIFFNLKLKLSPEVDWFRLLL
jgi:hypothetical protein